MVFSACGKRSADNTVNNPDGTVTDANGNIINPDGTIADPTDPADPYASLFTNPRPDYDWRENVYREYALNFKLENNEPYHIFDINAVDGKIIAVAKINTETEGKDVVDYHLVTVDNEQPDVVNFLEMPAPVQAFENSSGTGIVIVDSDYSGLKVCYDGSIIGLYSGTLCIFDAEGNMEMSGVRYMTHWAADGSILWNTDVSEYMPYEYGFVKYTNLLSDGRVVVFTECDKVYGFIIDTAGDIAFGRTIDAKDGLYYISDIEATSNGKDVAFFGKVYSEEEIEDPDFEPLTVDAAYFDADTLMLTEAAVIPYEIQKNDYYSLNNGLESDYIYSNASGVYSFNIGDAESTPVMNYANSDFRGYFFTDIAAVSEDTLMGIFTTYDEGIMIVAGFEAVDTSTLESIQTIKLGVYGLDYTTRKIVREYNSTSTDYRIVIDDYAEKEKQLEQLKEDLINRTGPDLLMVDPRMFDYCELADMGLLVEFEELAADDMEISGANVDNLADTYLMNVMDAYAINGKHYLYMYDFYYNIYTGRGSSSILPISKTNWSIIDFDITYNQFHVGGNSLFAYDLSTAPVMIAYKNRAQFIDIMLKYDGTEFINESEGTCSFDSEDFMSLLAYAGSLPEVSDDNLPVYQDISVSYRNDNVLINENVLGMGTPEGFWSDMCRNFDGDYCCIGFPSRNGGDGCSGVISIAELPIAIIRNGNVDGAWNYARRFLLEDYQQSIVERGCGIPVLNDTFEGWFSVGIERSAGLYFTDKNGDNVFTPNTYIAAGQYCTVSEMTVADTTAIKNSITACTKKEFVDTEIIDIIKEETNLFFDGSITADEAAANIQSRVSAYMKK
ncbi:MAG: hypothetical protein MJ104_05830 [Lachnospiraceae bacterium]|nr:hypothetical protein [Lachnospiraceae bacterium]